jgi:hypothetical protein
MDMANLPEKQTPSSSEIETRDAFREKIADLIVAGGTPASIAKRMYPDDPRKRQNMRNRIRRMTYMDPKLALEVGLRAKGQMLLDLGPAVEAVGKRAKRGRMDAARVVMEATGFHNPKVKHEHSGDINIKIEMPRPQFHEVPDADVVED